MSFYWNSDENYISLLELLYKNTKVIMRRQYWPSMKLQHQKISFLFIVMEWTGKITWVMWKLMGKMGIFFLVCVVVDVVVAIVLFGFYLILLLLSNQFQTNFLLAIRGINWYATLFSFHMVPTLTLMEHWF